MVLYQSKYIKEVIVLYFVRHGATDWNEYVNELGVRDPKCQGYADIEINDKGRMQAQKTAKSIQGIKFDRVICSPLKRARQTLEIIYHGDVTVEYDPRVAERNFGEYEGVPRSQLDFISFWNRDNQNFIKAESIIDVEKRLFPLLDELRQKPDQNVLIVSHGGLGGILTCYFKGLPEKGNYYLYEVPHGEALVLDFNDINNKF